MSLKNLLLTTATLSLLSLTPAHTVSSEAKEIIGKTAVEYLKNHPEAFSEIVASVQEHAQKEQEKQQSAKIEKYSSDLFSTKTKAPFMGNPKGTTEVIVFMDPFCHYCRKFEETLQGAVEADKNLKVVARDIAIMHEKSLMLIKATVAASKQGKYAGMQSAVHKVDPSVTEADVYKMARDLKLNIKKFTADLKSKDTEALIKENMDLADKLDVTATPTFVIKKSKKLIAGYVPLEAFQNLLKG